MEQQLLDKTGLLYLRPHSNCGCLPKACRRPSQSTFQHGWGKGPREPTPGCWRRESHFSRVWPLVREACSSGCPTPVHIYAVLIALNGLLERYESGREAREQRSWEDHSSLYICMSLSNNTFKALY